MTRINRFTMGILAVLFLTAAILISGTRLLQAQTPTTTPAADSSSTVERRVVNKGVRDLPPEAYARAKAATPDNDRLILMGLVENFFVHNAKDITARKSLEWGEVKKHADGSRSIRYKFEARIWDRDTMIADQIFTFDKDNVILSFKDVDGPPRKKQPIVVDTNTKDGVIALVEDFFQHNFRDVTSRKTIEWGDIEKDKDGNVSIRYKYEAKIWDTDTQIITQVFTFDPKGKFVSVNDVEGNQAIQEQVYQVNKKVSAFPEKEDLSTPEAAYATLERAYTEEGNAAWPRLSMPNLAKRMPQSPKEPLAKAQAQRSLDAEILEVHIWKDTHAVVIARMMDGRNGNYIDLRWLQRLDGRWLNAGNDITDTIEQARQKTKTAQTRTPKAAD